MFPADRLPLVERYVELLATEGVTRGLVGPREVPRLWERHLLNCVAVAEVMPESASVCDVGSGAGLPGLVLALARPDLAVTLLEPLLRRTTFLEEVVAELGLSTVEVVRGRAEALHGERSFDVVVSRAVAPLPRLLEWCLPLVGPGGAVVALKGESAVAEIEEARSLLQRWGGVEPELVAVGAGLGDAASRVVRVARPAGAGVGWRLAPTAASQSRRSSVRRRKKSR
ncbi:MAG: 16S rRNA (guanine(527)-N(7))-methyltransferase RsmG [Nocardioidaceae bacterium]